MPRIPYWPAFTKRKKISYFPQKIRIYRADFAIFTNSSSSGAWILDFLQKGSPLS
jgi:hypothetical protein